MPVIARRAVAPDRPLRHRRAVQAEGPQGRRPGPRDDARGDADLPRRARGPLLPRPAADPLPLPDQGARRAAPARRVLRTREFIMKDAYTFDRDREGSTALRPARRRLRPDLRPRRARVVPGRVGRGDDGRLRRHEYMAPCRGGRERGGADRRRATRPTSRWRARRRSRSTACPRRSTPRSRSTPRARRRSTRSPGMLGVPAGALIKAFPVIADDARPVLVAGPRRPPRQRDQAAERARRRLPARAGGRGARAVRHAPGFIGPVGAKRRGPGRRGAARLRGLVAGANEPDKHLRGVEPGRDFDAELGRHPHRRGGRHRPRAGRRSGSSRRSRWATSSSSARATRSRSAPPTSTRTARSS